MATVFQLNPGNGVLFANDKKGKQGAPDFKGEILLETGQKIKLSGWYKMTKHGAQMISLKENNFDPQAGQYPKEVKTDFANDDKFEVPF